MTRPTHKSPLMRLAAIAALTLTPLLASAETEGVRATAANKTVEAECSACHMAYPAPLLPKRSWHKIMTTLDNHFGEDASLDEASRATIEDYLTKYAADTGGNASGLLWKLSPQDTPMRISKMPWFVSQHRYEVSASAKKRAGSMSNCNACHRSAGRGNFDDD